MVPSHGYASESNVEGEGNSAALLAERWAPAYERSLARDDHFSQEKVLRDFCPNGSIPGLQAVD
jgi:hypothetical protein